MDTFTNFVCIWLSYELFDKYYFILFQICDAQCHQLWMKCTTKANPSDNSPPNENEATKIEMVEHQVSKETTL